MNKEEFLQTCQTGDLLLYNSNTLAGRAVEWFSGSRYSHVAIILRDPTYIRSDLKGLYILESGSEQVHDVLSKKKVIGVQVVKLLSVLKEYENGRFGNLYYRRLRCKRDDDFREKIRSTVNQTDAKWYDVDALDWIKALFHIELGNEQRVNTFWCSALVSYVYVQLGFLENTLRWTIVSPRQFSYYENDCLSFVGGCTLDPERALAL